MTTSAPASRLRLQLVSETEAPALESFADHTLHQTKEWLQFVAATQRAEPVHAAILDGERVVGRFTGLMVRKMGMRILGAPFPGWTTSYMGVNLQEGHSRLAALEALRDFAFRELGCIHLEVMDRRITVAEAEQAGYLFQVHPGFEIDLTQTDKQLLDNMKDACRRCIKKADKSGVRIEEARDPAFVDEYYEQLQDVFAKQQLVPTYGKERVRALVEHLLPTGRLLLLRARSPEGTCIATGIFPAMNDTMFFWGGASTRPHQHYRPNEILQWHAMRHWKERGIARYDMGGAGEYKRKYGGRDIAVPWIRQSRFAFLERLRNGARRLVEWKQRMLGRNKS